MWSFLLALQIDCGRQVEGKEVKDGTSLTN